MGFSAFQAGFDHGYQVIYPSTLPPNGNKGGNKTYEDYVPTSHELQRISNQSEALRAKKKVATQDYKANEIKIDQLELQRVREGLADQALQEEFMGLMLERHQILLALLALDRKIKQLIQDDEAIILIMMTLQ